MAADPKTSAGARLERKAFRDYLRRQLRTASDSSSIGLTAVLNWVLARQARYDKRGGGLGR